MSSFNAFPPSTVEAELLKMEKISYYTGDVCAGLELTISLSPESE